MATLVLTAVGGAIGGPVGAALGGLAGQALDARVLGKPKGRQGPRLTELAVQTSSYGTPIARLFGTMRVAGTVIWSTDLIETRSKARGGKGQPSTTSYSYSASFAVALSGRAIAGVGRIWADGKLLRGAAGDFKSPCAAFRVHRGGEDQPVDPLIAAAEGVDAPAHRGVAYVVFEGLQLADFGNRIPSLTLEVVADPGEVAVGTIAAELGAGVLDGGSGGAALGGFSAYGDSVRDVVAMLTEAGGAWLADGGERLLLRDAAQAGAVIVVSDDGVAGGVRTRTIAPIESVPRTLSVAHYDPARDFQAGVQAARRPGAGYRDDRIELPAALGADAAKTLAEAMLARAEAGRVRRVVTTDVRGLAIAPGARLAIAGEAGEWRVTRAELEAMAVRLTLTPLTRAPLAAVATSGRVRGAPDETAGTTILAAFETPALHDELLTQPRLTIVAAGTGAGWRRAALLYSLDDGASWTEAGTTAAPAVIGTLAAPLAAAPATLIDQAHAIEVTLGNAAMELVATDAAGIERGDNLALVGDELVQFEMADEVQPGRWRLRGLRRGLRGTAPQLHPAGMRFVLLEEDSALTIALPVTAVARTVRIMASGVGDIVPIEASAPIDGRSIVPPAPVQVRIEAGALRWTRRSRIGWGWRDAIDAPLGEESERYRVEVATAVGTRSVLVDAPELTLTGDELADDSLTATIRQIGTNGESAAAIFNEEEQ